MIKTSINRHDLEYYLYAMVKAFFPEEQVLAPDTALHNIKEDASGEQNDRIDCLIKESSFSISMTPGIILKKDASKTYDTHEGADSQAYKDEIRGDIYDFLSEYTGKQLRWGNLTGIRPTKLYLTKIMEMTSDKNVSENSTEAEAVIKNMEKLHRVSPLKGKLAMGIALRERKIIESLNSKDSYSLYIGIPFCPSRCLYCSFTSNPISMFEGRVGTYIECIIKEIAAVKEIMKGKNPDTVYIGGGTPTALSALELQLLLEKMSGIMSLDGLKEFTVEAGRPDSITKEKLMVLKEFPVNRISVNPQTMNDKTLEIIGRKHTVRQFEEAFAVARELGFDNINTDIILGLPGEKESDIEHTIKRLTKMRPDSLTVHSLAIKRASRLKELLEDMGDLRTLDFDRAMDIATGGADEMGLLPYYLYRQKDMGGNLENTGFAREGKFGFYNVAIMEEVQTIIACGAGTVTKRVYGDGRIERCDTVKDVNLYISKIEEMIDRKRQLFMTTEC